MKNSAPKWAEVLNARLDRIEAKLSGNSVPYDEWIAFQATFSMLLQKLTTRSRDDERLTSTEVMKRFRMKSRVRFWQFVHKNAVPHIRISTQNIIFPRAALEAWEDKRTIGKVPDVF